MKKFTNRLLVSVLLLNTGLYASDDDAAFDVGAATAAAAAAHAGPVEKTCLASVGYFRLPSGASVIDFSNMDVVDREINRVNSRIKGKQKALQDLVDLSNGRRARAHATMKRDVKAIRAQQQDHKKMALERANAYEANADEYRVLKNKKAQTNADLIYLAESVERLTPISREEGRQGLSPEMNDIMSQMVQKIQEEIELDALQKEKIEKAKKLGDVGALRALMEQTSLQKPPTPRHFFNRPGHKMSQKLEQQKTQEIRDRLAASANSDEVPEALKSTLLKSSKSLLEQRPATAAAAAAAAPEPVSLRPKGTECLTADEFSKYTMLENELRPLKRHANFLSLVFTKLLLRSEVKKSEPVAVQKPTQKISKAKLTREINEVNLAKEAELRAHEQAQAALEMQKEQEEEKQNKAALRALKKEQDSAALLAAQKHEAAEAEQPVGEEKPETLYLPYCVETVSFSKTFEGMNERTKNALEAVISDLMLGGRTVRSRGVLQGIMCIVNGKELRIGHADYLGPKDRLFYAFFNSHLILLQAGSHDFDLRNRVATL